MAQIQNETIYRLPYIYTYGLQLSYASTTVIAVAPGSARDSNNVMDLIVGGQNYLGITNPPILFQGYKQGLFINSRRNGINGLDQGTIAPNTQYAVYLIGDSRNYNNTAAVLSLTSNAFPLVPPGYDSIALIGFVKTDVSSNFTQANYRPQNIRDFQVYFNNPGINVVNNANFVVFSEIDLATNNAVPIPSPLPNVVVTLFVTFTPASVGNTAQFRPTGSSATAGVPTITGISAGIPQTQYIEVIAGVNAILTHSAIDYKVTSVSDSISFNVVKWVGIQNTVYPVLA